MSIVSVNALVKTLGVYGGDSMDIFTKPSK